ncbi:MAG TPA: HDIG domain-containing protein [Candidatus Hydrogenedentes bacterium]|nr:HDIG domain-containing protein [Candidatus Hydrogenedentota bacterium]HPC14934.1 HDIG domain-containing protein [Candidatus Hydrogenedentota bacterium]HRT18798.1 HDIG domain-containing protein [Candidatus Hydrogenedentota bacterium]HRT65756.1 HDIG domain-containing protein [Candidatus Hydrogenedentota bacterium]
MAIQLFVVCLAFAALVTRLPGFSIRSIGYDIENQTVAMEEVRAAIPFQSEDLQATKEKRDEAAKATLDTYRVDRERVAKQLQLLDDRIQFLASKRAEIAKAVREALQTSTSAQSEEEIVRKALLAFVERIEPELRLDKPVDAAALACWIEPAPETLPKRVFASTRNRPRQTVVSLQEPPSATYVMANLRDLSQLARDSLEYVLSYGILPENRVPAGEDERFSVIRDVLVGDLKPVEEIPCKKLPTVRTAPDLLRARLADVAREAASRNVADRPVDWTRLQQAAFELARTCITETLSYDAVYTEGAREHARLMVPPVVKEIQTGEVIQRSGDRWTAQSRADVRAYWAKLRARQAPWSRLIGIASANTVLAALAVACLARVIAFLTRKSDVAQRHMRVVCVLILGTLFLGRVIQYFDPSGFSAPIAAAGILAAILTNARVAVMASVIAAFLISIQYGYDWRLFVVGASMALAGVFGTFRVRRRGDMTRAALSATIVGILVVLAVTIGMDSLAPGAVLRRVLLVLGGGVACVFIVPGVLSPLERLFGITTDIQLLEFSDLNNELLSRIAIEMPGTYAHSLMLGQLAEAAADAIGANGLLARVAAYYHDVGKLRHPEYFSENQSGPNIHDTLPPRASARAIAAHVAHGVEIAREHHLPQPIINAIQEHHGTTLISFFHQKACERQRHDEVREEDYRYPGPKPQSRESAILMICDAVESGVRSIKSPNEERIRDFADKIIMNRWSDRQLEQCHLTLRDLDAIKEILVSRVMTSFHTRIAYPDKGGDRSAANVIPMPGG